MRKPTQQSITMVASLVAAVLIVVSLFVYVDRPMRVLQSDQADRRVGACLNYNLGQTQARENAYQDKLDIATFFFGYDPETVEMDLASQLASYKATLPARYPYRDCTQQCVDAYNDPDAAKCPSVLNEDGTP